MDRCNECGFQYDLGKATAAGEAIVVAAAQLAATLEDPRIETRSRRQLPTWSPVEYGCHLRDVLLVQRERVLLARRVERPSLEPMGRDERADHDGYGAQDPFDVARQLVDAARMFRNVLARLDPKDWERIVRYNYPEPAERSLRWVATHTLHEAQHHLLDVQLQLPGNAM
ncbi:MAG TPA: DinB family protein [Acidimicrobiales bacterium]|nr:DinB family protein [Acidimicrobiales bacterium]